MTLSQYELNRQMEKERAEAAVTERKAALFDELVAALEKARDAGVYVVKLCEANIRAADDPSPFARADWVATTSHCYAAMNFLPEAHAVLARAKEISE